MENLLRKILSLLSESLSQILWMPVLFLSTIYFTLLLVIMNSVIDSPAQRTEYVQSAAPKKISAHRLRQLHRFAGLTLAVFIAMHLTNHLFALFSVERHIAIMDLLRLVYRNPLGETILLAAVLIQVPSGIMLVKRKGWRGLPLVERAQVASGGYLAFFLVAHVFAVMMGRYFFHLDTNFYFASAVLFSPVWLFYVVYYGLSVVAVFTHVGSIHYQKMLSRTSSERAQIQALMIVGVGLTVTVLILLAFSGVVYEIRLPAAYKWW
jgi:succinate dehydrogenase/fumarate reductase cytochrome b subunit